MQDGVVLGADTRATEGETVCDKNCEKIHYIADNIWCCGAGTSADTEATTQLISSQIELHRLATGKAPRTITAMTMLKRKLFQYQGHISAALVLGGFDCNGPSLYTVRARVTDSHLRIPTRSTRADGGPRHQPRPAVLTHPPLLASAARYSRTARQITFPT